jgi:hypothetical protein
MTSQFRQQNNAFLFVAEKFAVMMVAEITAVFAAQHKHAPVVSALQLHAFPIVQEKSVAMMGVDQRAAFALVRRVV